MNEHASLDPRLQELLDRQAIADCLHRYAQAIDRRDDVLLAEQFEPGAMLHYGVFDGSIEALLEGRREEGPFAATHHQIGNIRIRFDAPDRARSIAYLNVVHRARRDGALVDELMRARYLDRLVKRDDVWRFAERTLVYDWSRVMPADATNWWDGSAALAGTRDAHDPGAAFLD